MSRVSPAERTLAPICSAAILRQFADGPDREVAGVHNAFANGVVPPRNCGNLHVEQYALLWGVEHPGYSG